MEKRTVIEAMADAQKNSSALVMVQRHYSYLSGPTSSRATSEADLFARNYSEIEPPCLFLCDRAGIEQGWKHGRMLAEAGIEKIKIIASHQGRGPDSGLRISEGYHEATGSWIPVECHAAADYPRYNYDPCVRALQEAGDAAPAQWLNGKRDDLIRTETPESFAGRVDGLIRTLLRKGGIWIVTTHFELCVLTHGIYVARSYVGNIPEDYVPIKGGGVLIMKEKSGCINSYDYGHDYELS
jgi:hypothetical protein